MKISKITIKDFRAFAHETEFGLADGKNLLLYGENGSGKSSLFHALRELFGAGPDPNKPYADFRNIFASGTGGAPTAMDGVVSLELVDGSPPAAVADPLRSWSHGGDRPPHNYRLARLSREQMDEARGRGAFLDYKSLLRTNYHGAAPEEELFELCVNVLLADVRVTAPGGKTTTVGKLWQAVLDARPRKHKRYDRERMTQALIEFNNAVKGVLPSIQTHLHDFLRFFDHGGVTVEVGLPGVGFDDRSSYHTAKRLTNKEFTFKVSLNGVELTSWKEFLNEARLSALALSLFLAAVKLRNRAPTGPVLRVLVLDDVLIGLDLSNRLPVLRILEQRFSDYQIFLLTHDKVWFDMASLELSRPDRWCRYEMYTQELLHDGKCFRAPWLRPAVEKEMELFDHFIGIAKRHLAVPNLDPRTAAFFARVALEVALKHYCHSQQIPVRYNLNPRLVTVEQFLDAVEDEMRETGKHPVGAFALRRLDLYKHGVLNPSAHFHPVTLAICEVEAAVHAVVGLKDALKRTEKNFAKEADAALSSPPGTDVQRIDAACWLRTAFEADVRKLLRDKAGAVRFDTLFSVPDPKAPQKLVYIVPCIDALWDAAKSTMTTRDPAKAPTVIAGIENHRDVFLDDWIYGRVHALSLQTLIDAWGALKDATAPGPEVKTLLATFP